MGTPKPRGRTGPRSARGKAQSARNALRHGLAVPVLADPALSQEVYELARRIAAGDDRLLEPALHVAEAQVDLMRIQQARSAMSHALSNPMYISRSEGARLSRFVVRVWPILTGARFHSATQKPCWTLSILSLLAPRPSSARSQWCFRSLRISLGSLVTNAARSRAGNLRSELLTLRG